MSESKYALAYAVLAGRVIRELREKLAIDQERLAALTSLTQSTVSRIERGEGSLTVDQLGVIAKAFGYAPGELLSLADGIAASAIKEGGEVRFERSQDGLFKDEIFEIPRAALSKWVKKAIPVVLSSTEDILKEGQKRICEIRDNINKKENTPADNDNK